MGITQDPETNNIMMVLNWCDRGDLRKNFKRHTTYKDIYLRLLEISTGLEKIHKAQICHRDLHVGNIMIGDNSGTFIGDFGQSIMTDQNVIGNESVVGVLPFIAPEVFKGEKYTPKADIYSFGMLAWSLLTHQLPFSYQNWEDSQFHWDIIENHLRPKIPDWTPEWLCELIKRCFADDVSERPNATDISEIIRNNYENSRYLHGEHLPLSHPVEPHQSAIYKSRTWPITKDQ